MSSARFFVRSVVVSSAVLAASIALVAQGRGGGAAGPVLVPVTASSLATHPSTYVGQVVAMTATVEKQLSATVFTVDQDKSKSQPNDVLVIAPTLQSAPPPNTYVSVIGDAVTFDPADLSKLKGYTLDIPADVAAKYKGHPAVFATSVVTADLNDIAKKKPVPMTTAEMALSNVMKQVAPASAALRTAVSASDAAESKKRAAELTKLFGEAQTFFKAKSALDAQGWVADAIKFAGTVDTAATAGKWPDATAAATSLNGLCASCHTAHRDRLDDGTYRWKDK